MFEKIAVFPLILFLFASVLLPAAHTESITPAEFDYNIFDALLQKYVDNGRVDYLAWKRNDLSLFEEYIESLKDAAVTDFSGNSRKAFWINAYNALTIYAVLTRIPDNHPVGREFSERTVKAFLINPYNALTIYAVIAGILDNHPVARIFSVQMVPGFFSKKRFNIGGESLSLDDIEHKKLRGAFHDPRVHFAIVCASRSCPELQNHVFYGRGLNARLDKAARSFLSDTSRNRLDAKKRTLYLSQLFNWYKQDFIDDAGSVIQFIKKYANSSVAKFIAARDFRVKYLYYDWLVNIKK